MADNKVKALPKLYELTNVHLRDVLSVAAYWSDWDIRRDYPTFEEIRDIDELMAMTEVIEQGWSGAGVVAFSGDRSTTARYDERPYHGGSKKVLFEDFKKILKHANS